MLLNIYVAHAGLCEWQLVLQKEMQERRAAIETKLGVLFLTGREQAQSFAAEKQQDLDKLRQEILEAEKRLTDSEALLAKHESDLKDQMAKAAELEILMKSRLFELRTRPGILQLGLRSEIAGIWMRLLLQRKVVDSEQNIGNSLRKSQLAIERNLGVLRKILKNIDAKKPPYRSGIDLKNTLLQTLAEAKAYPELAIEAARNAALRFTVPGQSLAVQFETLRKAEAAFDQVLDAFTASRDDSSQTASVLEFDSHCNWLGIPLPQRGDSLQIFSDRYETALKEKKIELEEESRNLALEVLRDLEINLDPPH